MNEIDYGLIFFLDYLTASLKNLHMSLHTCLVTCKKLHATPVKLCHYKLMSQTASEECLFVQPLIV